MNTLRVTELVLQERVQKAGRQFIAEPSHALIVQGPSGVGKRSFATHLAQQLDIAPSYTYRLAPIAGKAIPIESIRELQHFLLLKVPTNASINRLVIIEDADKMTLEAQNALLKNLEEPPAGTVLVLTAANLLALLPTIRSRAQLLSLTPPSKEQVIAYFTEHGHASQDIARVYAMTGGLPGLMHALLTDDAHPLVLAVQKARALLQADQYERLLQVDELTKQPDLLIDTLFILRQMADVSLQTATDTASTRWQHVLQASYDAAAALSNKGQPRLVLTSLMLNLA